ncbi:MAG: polysaccharide pyruvyl transferase family protein [Oscillospiraceae bacterium]|nr:polysaccharide pyruvyl transferase family protein [Oscillospiraceae bacterium]MCI9669921.1 polysaccharide pyruvyl transferase family protein [Oscillospiraceae bacterium]
MKYANFKDTGRCSVNIGDYLQFMAADYLLYLMNVPKSDIVYLGFQEVIEYKGEDVIFPFCYSIIDFVRDGKISISSKIKPYFFAVTLSTVDKFMDLDQFLSDEFNYNYLSAHAPIGCRDEITYQLLSEHYIPAYINGCMTAIFPHYIGRPGEKTLFVDAPKALLQYIPDLLLKECEFSTQQYYFQQSDIDNYKKMFDFVAEKYRKYSQAAKLVITSRLHVALPLTALGIPVILAKDRVDGRFSFIESYIPIYGKEQYHSINWNPEVPDIEKIKELLVAHAIGRLRNNIPELELIKMEQDMTELFQTRKIENTYQQSHIATHNNGYIFDKYAAKYWKVDKHIQYAFWGVSENNLEYWKRHIETNYPYAELVAIFDSFREGQIAGFSYRRPETIIDFPGINIIVCSVGAAQQAQRLFQHWNFEPKQYCITADCFIRNEDVNKAD